MFVDPSGEMFLLGGGIDFFVMADMLSFRASHDKKTVQTGIPLAGRAANFALNSGRSVKELRKMRDSGSSLFKRIKQELGGDVQIHHIVEKRFFGKNISPAMKKILNKYADVDEMPGIVLSRERHRVITSRWRKAINTRAYKNPNKKYGDLTDEDIFNAANEVYKDDPIQRVTVIRGILNKMYAK